MTRPLRVMAFGFRGFPRIQGGIETHAENLYPRLASQGCDVSVIARAGYREQAAETKFHGVRMQWIWAPRVRGLEALVHSVLALLLAATKRPDIVHIHAIGPALVTPLARALGLKVVVTHHGPDYERQKWGRFAKWLLRLGERFGMRTAHGRIVISAGIRDLVLRKYGVDCDLIPNGVQLPELPAGTESLERFGLEPRKYVLQVSRLVPEKRQLDLINAFKAAQLPGWKLVLVGDTEFPDAYSRSVFASSREDPSIICTGFQTGRTLHELYAHAGVFVLPSAHEGLPIALLEALSYGLRTLASNIPANLEVGLDPGDYYELGNLEQLTSALRAIATEPGPRAAQASRRSQILAEHDWNEVARKTLRVFQRVVDQQSDRAEWRPL